MSKRKEIPTTTVQKSSIKIVSFAIGALHLQQFIFYNRASFMQANQLWP